MKFIILMIATLGFQQAMAQQITSISEIGNHYEIFDVEKNENPQNILIAYTKLDDSCHVVEAGNTPTFDVYWMMNRQSYKPTHPMIKSGIMDRLQVQPADGDNGFYVRINDLKEVNADLHDPRLSVVTQKSAHGCQVHSYLTLGPSDKNITIDLQSIYSESAKTMMPPFRRVLSITLNGTNVATGEKISRKYLAK